MRIRKQLKQALSLIFGTLIAVFAFALLLVTITDLNTNSTASLVDDAHVHESPQSQTQPSENIPQAPTADEQEQTNQEQPVEVPAAPLPSIEDDSVGHEAKEKTTVNIKLILIIIGGVVLAAAIITGIVLLIHKLTKSRLYKYELEIQDDEDAPAAEELAESTEWERDISDCLSSADVDEEMSQGIAATQDNIIYKTGRGYCYSPDPIETNINSGAEDVTVSAATAEEVDMLADIPIATASSFVYDHSGESDIDYVDIPRLFTV